MFPYFPGQIKKIHKERQKEIRKGKGETRGPEKETTGIGGKGQDHP